MALATFWRAITIAVVVTGATALGSGSSSAHPSVMLTGGITSQPIGHYNYCQRFLGECAIRPDTRQPHSASLEFLRTLRDVTVAVNLAIRPVSDSDLYGVDEFWTLPDGGHHRGRPWRAARGFNSLTARSSESISVSARAVLVYRRWLNWPEFDRRMSDSVLLAQHLPDAD